MGQRSMPCTSQMIDLEMDQQGPNYLLPEPCVILGGVTTFPQPDMQTMAGASSNPSNLDAPPMFYAMPPYHGVPHHPHPHHHNHNLDIGMGPAPNFFVPYMSAPDHLPPSGSFGVVGISPDEYARNAHFMDNMRGSYKRKNTEGVPGGFHYFNNGPSSSSSSVVAPMSTSRHPDRVAPMEVAYYPMPQYRANAAPSIREVDSQRSVRNRLGANGAMDPGLAQNQNPLVPGNYVGPPFQPAGAVWIEQPGDGGGGSAPPVWNQTPALPYMRGSSISGANMETGNMAVQHYPETSGNRNSSAFVHPSPSINVRPHAVHHPLPPPPPVQGVRGHNVTVHPQLPAAPPFRVPSSYPTPQNSLEMMTRHAGSVPSTGLRIYQTYRDGTLPPQATLRQRGVPHFRVMPTDGVALLEMPELYEVGNFVDHHRDMRLDIEDMSYEELLALGERIGNVNTGVSEATISKDLKTRTYVSTSGINLEEPASSMDQESDSCIICQEEYQNQEKLGTLDCGHEYHAKCLKKWLVVKNVCPICKSEALAGKRKD